MLKISNLTRNVKRILVIFVFAFLTLAITSCKGKNVDSIDLSKDYLSVNGYTVSNGDVWKEIKWDAAALFTDKAKEAVLSKELETIKTVMNDKNNENYKYYSERLKNYLLEDVYDLEFSLEDHYKEIDELDDKAQAKKIASFADDVYQEKFADMNTEAIKEALTNDKQEDLDSLRPLYKHYFLDLAQELFARTKLEEEIKNKNEEHAKDDDEDTVGYFTKSDVNEKYKQEYLNKGTIDAIVIKFASADEAKQTLKAFGIFVDNSTLYYLTKTPTNYSEYSKYYDKFTLNKAADDEYVALSTYSDAAVLQLYIAMYNYIYTYRQGLENLNVDQAFVIDQRATTKSIIDQHKNAEPGAESENKRIKEIYEFLIKNEDSKKFVTYEAETVKETNKPLYEYLYQTLVAPDYFGLKEETENDTDIEYKAYSTSVQSLGEGQFMAFKIKQEITADDKIYETNITSDDLYKKLTSDGNKALYENIIKDLTDEKLTKDYITGKIDEAVKDVKVKIFDKDIEIAYAKDHSDYSKTLSGAPNNNTIAEFKYDNTVVTLELSNEGNTGAWDLIEHKSGQVTAINLISKKMIKDSDEYKNIAKEDVDTFYEAIEYILATFANDGLAQSGYPAALGKYNFLMLYYHTADIDEIVADVFKINTVISDVLVNYNSDSVINFFNEYTQKAYDNYFSIGSTVLKVYRDTNEDGKEDDINDWKDLVAAEFDGENNVKYEDIAKQLINDVYTLIKNSSTDHQTKLNEIVSQYNSSSRHNPSNEGYDPIPNEKRYAKYKALGFALKTVDVTVTNSSNDIDPTIKNKLNQVYKDENFAFKDFFPSQYLEDASKDSSIVLAENAYNYFLITSAAKPASAKYEDFKDVDKIYKDLYYRYNYNTIKVDNVYNENDKLTLNQIKAFLFEQLNNESSNLLPSDLQSSLESFLKPVLSRFQSGATQSRITLNYVCNGDVNKLTFADLTNLERFNELKAISERKAEDYIKYESAEDELKYNNFINWFEKIDNINTVGGNK